VSAAAASAAAKITAASAADSPGLRGLTGGVHIVGADSLVQATVGAL